MKRTMVFLSSIHKYSKPAHTSIQRTAPAPMLIFLTRGSGLLSMNGYERKLEALEPLLLLPGMSIRFQAGRGDFEYYVLMLDAVGIAKQRESRKVQLPELPAELFNSGIKLHSQQQISERIARLYETASQADKFESRPEREMMIQLQFQELYSTVLLELLELNRIPTSEKGMQESINYLHKHLHEKINLEQLASIAMLTPTSYSRKFKKVMGVTPFEYLAELRVKEAKAQLSLNGASVRSVSERIGFGSEFYFSRVFKAAVGISPNLYMKRHQLKIAVVACSSFDDSLRSLGIYPIASMNCFRYPGMGEAEHLRKVTGHLQTLMLLKPDLILIDRYHHNYEEPLKQIASTACLEHHADWRIALHKIAEMIGCELTEQTMLSELAQQTDDARKQLGRSVGSGSLTLMRVTHNAVRIQGAPDHPLNELLFTELGLTAGSSSPAIDHKVEMQPEQLSGLSIQSDYLFVQKLHHGPSSDQILQRMQSSPFWKKHEAVQSGRVRFIPNWYAMCWTPIGRKTIMDSLLLYTDGQHHA
ncbi:AraC family transcriptional regulator [Paenibacillus sp. FSL H8-0537]|uniref:AraC family transcriptional regulator n=1 Tax=Paenibacillus sp. FSL H8-0537 TaxID=2921399 RepID=UPI0031018872